MARSRAQKLEHFYSLRQGGSVLDVGVSGHPRFESSNLFLSSFGGADHLYTGLGIVDLTDVAAAHPGKRFVTYDGGRFPFTDKEFSWAFSNAVIEHVGDFDRQVEFVNEMLRAARNVFFTTPNRYFPIETHTNVPLLHWFDWPFFAWCCRYRPYRTPQNLRLLSRRALDQILKASNARYHMIYSNRFLGYAMTFTVVCSDRRR